MTGARSKGRFVQELALWIGGANLTLGVFGFVPGLTLNFDELRFFGAESKALIIGVFRTSILLNSVHLILGVWAIIAAKEERRSREYLVVSGVIYLGMYFLGDSSLANLVALNAAARWLHLVLAGLTITAVVVSIGQHHRVPGRRR
ncbi:DUF4383 domain-containing protein [Kribbella deserti]|uniref:DUF4383 domain-containing protein n=1 Tax=Kribbella deserti TaxID=1926257 RepID=A0ABV6QF92_9ACTN